MEKVIVHLYEKDGKYKAVDMYSTKDNHDDLIKDGWTLIDTYVDLFGE